ncbi:MAG TPA: alcohol dehydrogenase catalytic domain-containing protein [Ktedonobacteraceae bacterium]
MRTLVIERPGHVLLQERPIPVAQTGEVLVRPLAVGICGSDLDLLRGTRPVEYGRYPIVPGHEWAAEIVTSSIEALPPGTPVAVEGHHYCRMCARCRQGATNLCVQYDEFGFTHDGGLAELVVVRADLLHPFQRELPAEYAALTEPAACALHGVESAEPRPGETIVIIGPGTLGLLGVSLFAQYHPRRLIVVGRRASNQETALALGATHFVTGSPWEVQQAVQELTAGTGADIVYESAGQLPALQLAFQLARRGGRIILEGVAGDAATLSLPADIFLLKDLTVHGIFAYTSTHFEQALRLLEMGTITFAPLVTHRFSLAHYTDGIALLENKQERAIKVIIFPQQ